MFERVAREHEIVGVITRAPKPAGRKKIITPAPVEIWARTHDFKVFNKISDFDWTTDFDFAVVASYGVIIKDEILARGKFINIHPSDLPAYRGPAPMTTAIYNGDTHSAFCLMEVASEVDAGDVYMRVPFEIGTDDTNEIVEARVAEIGADMLSAYLAVPARFPGVAQSGTPSFTRKWTSADEIIDWSKTPAQIHNQIRAIGGRTKINGIDVKILKSSVVSRQSLDVLEILQVQPAGKKPMDWQSFVNGQRGVINFGSL